MPIDFDGLDDLREELEEFKRDIEETQKRVPDAIDDGIEKTAKQAVFLMKSKAPVDTGELKASIGYHKSQSGGYSVGPTAEHAPYVEYGTEPHEITSNGSTPMQFVVDGKYIETHHVNHPGTPAQPFFRPAINMIDENDIFEDNLRDEVEDVFDEVM